MENKALQNRTIIVTEEQWQAAQMEVLKDSLEEPGLQDQMAKLMLAIAGSAALDKMHKLLFDDQN